MSEWAGRRGVATGFCYRTTSRADARSALAAASVLVSGEVTWIGIRDVPEHAEVLVRQDVLAVQTRRWGWDTEVGVGGGARRRTNGCRRRRHRWSRRQAPGRGWPVVVLVDVVIVGLDGVGDPGNPGTVLVVDVVIVGLDVVGDPGKPGTVVVVDVAGTVHAAL